MPPITELTRIEPVYLDRLEQQGVFTTGILLEVSEDGTLTRSHNLAINNPNVNGVSELTLDQNSVPPARIKFLPLGDPELTGNAMIKR